MKTFNRIILGDLLERLCKKTEFEVEGWRKIPPLIDMLKESQIQSDVLETMKLNMIQNNAEIDNKSGAETIINLTDAQWIEARRTNDVQKLGGKRIRNSWIYRHFQNPDARKIALYVNAGLPGNDGCGNVPVSELVNVDEIYTVGNHCVVVEGIESWNGKECLVIDNAVGSEELKYIPVDFPFFEEVQIQIAKHHDPGKLDTYGKELCKMKFGEKIKLRNEWYKLKKETAKDSERNIPREELPCKYPMLFVCGRYPCFQLRFTS